MKNKVLVAILCGSMILGVTGCSSSNSKEPEKVEVDKAEDSKVDTAEDTKVEKSEDSVDTAEDTKVEKPEDSGDTEDEEPAEKEASITAIVDGDTLETEELDIHINKVELTYDVLPDNTEGLYTHYAADSGNVYICVDMDIKNKQKQDLPCDEILTIKANYNDGYEYTGSLIPEDPSTGFTYANITSIKPLETLGTRYLIECPQEVEETKNPLYLDFDLFGEILRYTIR